MMSTYPQTPSTMMLHDRVSAGADGDIRKRKRPMNCGSKILDEDENQQLFSYLGADNISLSAGVVELLKCNSRQWEKHCRGVISLVKDYKLRAYFMRIYDLKTGQILWDMKLYPGFRVTGYNHCPELLSFESAETDRNKTVYGLNFSKQTESREFKGHLDKRWEQENRGVQQRETMPTMPNSVGMGNTTTYKSPAPFAGSGGSGTTLMGTVAHSEKNNPSKGFFSSSKKGKKNAKARIRKEDISNPTNFQHKAHVGWNQDNGFSNNMDEDVMDESIQNIIKAAGKDPSNMSKKTIKFVYEFLESYKEDDNNGIMGERVSSTPNNGRSLPIPHPVAPQYTNNTSISTPPPPPPSRGASHQITAAPPARPPPPPPNNGKISSLRPLPQVPTGDAGRPMGVPPPPPPPPPSSSHIPPPPPPPPPSIIGGSAPPPPPPPPSTIQLPAPQAGRGDLLSEIQAGAKLRSVSNASENRSNTAPDARGNVMAQIRQGASLKHVDTTAEDDRRKSGLIEMGGIAGALAKALEERRLNMGMDDSSDEEESDDKNEWSD